MKILLGILAALFTFMVYSWCVVSGKSDEKKGYK